MRIDTTNLKPARTFHYKPPTTLAKFHQTCESIDIRLTSLLGPVGSAKSTAMVIQCLFFSEGQEPDADGVRKTRIAIIRNTLVQLKSTCLVSIEQLLGGLYTYKVADGRLEFRYDLPDGTKVHSDWILLPLDTPANVNRLLSLELSHAWVSEFYSVPLELVRSALSRVGRYPGKLSGVGCTNQKLIMETNAFTTENDYYEALYEDLPENWRHLIQPPAVIGPPDKWEINKAAENLENLPNNYYEDLMKSNNKAWTDRFLRCKILPPLDQQAVFANSYNPDIHEVDELDPIPHEPMCIGLDVGRNPAAVFTQEDAHGRKLVLHSLHAENVGTGKFLRDVVMPVIASDRYAACPVFFCLDPASIAKSQFGEEALFTEVKAMTNLPCTVAHTNAIDPRLRAIEQPLIDRNELDEVMLLIDRRYNQKLCLALSMNYRFKISKVTNEISEVPDKAHPWSDLSDGLGYSLLGLTRRIRAQYYRQMRMGSRNEPAPPVGGWT